MTTRRRPPGPKGHFLLGNLPEFSRDPRGFFTQNARSFGDVFSFRILHRPFWFVNHPDNIEYALVTHNRNFIKPLGLRANRRLFGNGLLLSEGDFWRRQRRLAQPAFHRERIAAYGEVIVAHAEQMLATWAEGQTRDIHEDLMRLTLEIVAQVLFDTKVAKVAADIGAALQVIMEQNAGVRLLLPGLKRLPIPGSLRLERAIQRLETITYDMIRQRRQGGADTADLLSLLLHARDEDGNQMTDRQLRDEVITLLLAGHETTALALTWSWYLLAEHPPIEAKLREHLRGVLGAWSPRVADLPHLPYVDWVIKEAMRLYPSAWWLGREAVEDCQIGGYDVPAGTTVTMSPWVMHRDSRYFDDPDEFRPERWANGLAKRLPTYAYFPFGGGPRLCIGASFALMEAALLLATVAQRFRLVHDAEHSVEILASITLRPKYGMKMSLAAPSAAGHSDDRWARSGRAVAMTRGCCRP